MADSLPYLEVSGTHFDVGFAIGTRFKDNISRRVNWQKSIVPDYKNLLKQSVPYFDATVKTFPKLIEELEGMAKGSQTQILDLFFINNRDLYDPSEDPKLVKSPEPDRCTIVVSFNQNGVIVGHNEDWPSPVEDFPTSDLYILKATIGQTTFMGLEYATEIPGDVANFNNWGLVQCINEMMLKPRVGVPKNFVARAILECRTLDEAEYLVEHTYRASGFNHILAQENRAANIEIAGEELNIHEILKQPYVHTNHYLTPDLKRYEEFHTKNSEHRLKKALELVKTDMKTEDIRNYYPITATKNFPFAVLGSR